MSSTEQGGPEAPATLLEKLPTLPLYRWRPLEDKKFRRLVHVYPAQSLNDTLAKSISHHTSTQLPRYSALSCHWGDPTPKHNIIVLPDASISFITTDLEWQSSSDKLQRTIIPSNLMLALRRLRLTSQLVTVWTDFLCINQMDIPEKNEQVQSMATVYSGASCVAVYLGEEDTENELSTLSSLLGYIVERLMEAELMSINISSIPRFTNELHRTLDEQLELVYPEASAKLTDQCFRRLFARPWFRRLWVVQEVRPALMDSSKVAFTLGDLRIPWWLIILSRMMVNSLTFDGLSAGGRGDTSAPVLSLVMNGELRLIDLLQQSQTLHVSDARGHCFGVLSISEYATNENLRPDYHEQVEATYLRYTIFLISEGYGPEILARCVKFSDQCPPMPSWAPDWSSGWSLGLRDGSIVQPALSGKHNSAGGTSRGKYEVFEGGTLRVSATMLERVSFATALDANEFENVTTRSVYAFRSSLVIHIYKAFLAWCEAVAYPDISHDAVYGFLMSGIAPDGTKLQSTPSWVPSVFSALGNIPDEGKVEEVLQLNDEVNNEWTAHLDDFIGKNLKIQICITERGHLAKLPSNFEHDDVIAIVLGCKLPLVLRRVPEQPTALREHNPDNNDVYKVVGYAYVHGLMDGQRVDEAQNRNEVMDLFLV